MMKVEIAFCVSIMLYHYKTICLKPEAVNKI
jgi:hypothetical protein